MTTRDPHDIDVDPDAAYVRLRSHQSASKIPNPLVEEEDEAEWGGHREAMESVLNDGGSDGRLEVDRVTRGSWGFAYIETRDGDLVDALEREGHEPLSADEFASMLEDAPSFIYLRTPKERAADRAARRLNTVEIVDLDDLDDSELPDEATRTDSDQ